MNRTATRILTVAGLSLPALTAGISTAFAQTLVLKDNFNDGIPTGWSVDRGEIREINQQFVVSGSFGPMPTNTPWLASVGPVHAMGLPPGPLPDRQTFEIRADLVSANQPDVWGGIHVVQWDEGVYGFFVGQDEVELFKMIGEPRVAFFFHEIAGLGGRCTSLDACEPLRGGPGWGSSRR